MMFQIIFENIKQIHTREEGSFKGRNKMKT